MYKMNPLESNSQYNSVNKNLYNIYRNSAYFNDARDMAQYGTPKGGSVFKTQKDIDMYIKEIVETEKSSGSAVYQKKKVSGSGIKKKVVPPQLKKWQLHVEVTRKAYPKLSFKEALAKAKDTYEKS